MENANRKLIKCSFNQFQQINVQQKFQLPHRNDQNLTKSRGGGSAREFGEFFGAPRLAVVIQVLLLWRLYRSDLPA
jgi:hypothetical protein